MWIDEPVSFDIKLNDMKKENNTKCNNLKNSDYLTKVLEETKLSVLKDYSFLSDDSCKVTEKSKPSFCGYSFSVAIKFLSAGGAIRRSCWSRTEEFIVKQIPSYVSGDIIPKMQSLPKIAKNILTSKENPHISYNNQMLIINKYGDATTWIPSTNDLFAEDWELVTE